MPTYGEGHVRPVLLEGSTLIQEMIWVKLGRILELSLVMQCRTQDRKDRRSLCEEAVKMATEQQRSERK